MLTEKSIEDFQKLYSKHFKVELTKEEAYAEGEKLVTLVELVLFGPKEETLTTNNIIKETSHESHNSN